MPEITPIPRSSSDEIFDIMGISAALIPYFSISNISTLSRLHISKTIENLLFDKSVFKNTV